MGLSVACVGDAYDASRRPLLLLPVILSLLILELIPCIYFSCSNGGSVACGVPSCSAGYTLCRSCCSVLCVCVCECVSV